MVQSAPQVSNFPRRWSEYSLDFRLTVIWSASLLAGVVLMSTHILDGVANAVLGGTLVLWFGVLLVIALNNRRRNDWRWPGLEGANFGQAALIAGAVAFFFYFSAAKMFPLTRESAPGFLFALTAGVTSVMAQLGLVQLSDEDFHHNCGDRSEPVEASQ